MERCQLADVIRLIRSNAKSSLCQSTNVTAERSWPGPNHPSGHRIEACPRDTFAVFVRVEAVCVQERRDRPRPW